MGWARGFSPALSCLSPGLFVQGDFLCPKSSLPLQKCALLWEPTLRFWIPAAVKKICTVLLLWVIGSHTIQA